MGAGYGIIARFKTLFPRMRPFPGKTIPALIPSMSAFFYRLTPCPLSALKVFTTETPQKNAADKQIL
jgi:hypothetical protein